MISEKISFRTMLNDGRKLYALTSSKDIGKMSEQLIPSGKQIWI